MAADCLCFKQQFVPFGWEKSRKTDRITSTTTTTAAAMRDRQSAQCCMDLDIKALRIVSYFVGMAL